MDNILKGESMEWISSIELIKKTNISRATLNNYIRMNILPKPDVRKPSDPLIRARRIGYFPKSALSTLEQIRSLKTDGLAMTVILDRLKKALPAPQRPVEGLKRKNSAQVSLFEDLLPEPAEKRGKLRVRGDNKALHPDFRSFCVLAADLQDADRVRAELHPEEYFDLVRQLWDSAWAAAESNRGLCGRHPWQGITLFYFLKTIDNPYLMDAVQCAMELREAMMKLTVEWKLRKGWFNELYLNIGISEGEEHLGFIQTPAGMSPATFGGALLEAIGLAEHARGGSIWMTKRVIQKMSRKDREKICYGISHFRQDREAFVKNSFARMRDVMPGDPSESRPFADVENLAVTEITDPI